MNCYASIANILFLLAISFAISSYPHEPWEFFSIHAFDHLDNLDKQAEPAHLCGTTVLYATGTGVYGYMGLPPEKEWEKVKKDAKEYIKYAKSLGIPTVLGYLCSTSIVGLKNFDKNFPSELKAQLSTPPSEWLQQDIHGKPLASWYGGEYNPACMSNPDWRKYQKYMVKTQFEIGVDGIFFDNPTVHPQGCYCSYCMNNFLEFLKSKGEKISDTSLTSIRNLAQSKPTEFKKFRCTVASNFLAEIRSYAKQINPKSVITANNSLNAPEVIFSQCHKYGYNIKEMSKSQDFVVIEDMISAPRRNTKGAYIECSPAYQLVNSILGGKTLVAVTIADGDYHTPPNLTKLAIFEAFTQNTNYMLWPTWEESHRNKMIQAIGTFVQWIKRYSSEIRSSQPLYDVMIYLPFEEWINQQECIELAITRELTKANIPHIVISEENFHTYFSESNLLIASNPNYIPPKTHLPISVLCSQNNKTFIDGSKKSFLTELKERLPNPSLMLTPNEPLRGVVRTTRDKIYLLLYNLNIERISSYEDKVEPVKDICIHLKIPTAEVAKVTLYTPEFTQDITQWELTKTTPTNPYIILKIPELAVAGIIEVVLNFEGK
ncbi:MAG: putative glycoside hydrolase family 15 protein [Candidatus Hydrogenedentes bacterium]|nr:putative glycoside hydrolase family 15 protein [Candidatus Hydrogenedentota bacterium]